MADADPKLPTTVNVHEAKTHLSKLLDRVHAGEEIIVAKAGKPYAKLVPVKQPKPRKPRVPGALKHLGPIPDSFFDPLPDDELDAWEGKYSSF
ncbi:MAG: type II toxin-antitoxin system Phd/YefM family antitoxin [Alphaproteobacteria bacterium]|nr:MAG: type II toxin-antitoxin system Phd/YefM family antitoxin [Alphaproteobacteria bacterium]